MCERGIIASEHNSQAHHTRRTMHDTLSPAPHTQHATLCTHCVVCTAYDDQNYATPHYTHHNTAHPCKVHHNTAPHTRRATHGALSQRHTGGRQCACVRVCEWTCVRVWACRCVCVCMLWLHSCVSGGTAVSYFSV